MICRMEERVYSDVTERRAADNSSLAQWRVTWLIEQSTLHLFS